MTPARTRALTRADVPALVRLVNAQGWSFTESDFQRMLRMGRGVAVEDDAGGLGGALTLIEHESQAWIGNVVTRPDLRGRGLGAALVTEALHVADAAGTPTVGLYSVLPAITLYERAGFRRGGEVASLSGRSTGRDAHVPKGVRRLAAGDLGKVAALDARAAGTRRERMLRVLVDAFPEHAVCVEEDGVLVGYAIGKPSPSGSEIGPLVTLRPKDARVVGVLVDALLALLPEGDVEAGVHRANQAAVRAFEERGFREAFPALAMYRGAAGHEVDPALTGAVAGMEKG